ncbi:MAG: sodium:alanine symporter family protein [Sutterella wadsworthensis]|uniref:alanine/glycine:cation symporter family protein n=1 Tax=Sutterella wadsworthensis TaxID=40545 RepID=UPI001ED7672C|nr:sodium:alanine symporter family protein [Sutterella wadsworthensis]MBD8909888.1 sodium:alanine symporter family protein [Sutterella wadsworthensis]
MEMDDFTQLVQSVNGLLWGMYCLIPLLVGTGIYLTIKLRFIQIRRFGQAFCKVFGGITLFGDKAGKDGMSSFQSLATAISAQVGTGNLAGVATAIAMGGPGAIFWMWLAAFFGMATIFAEATLAQVFRARDAHGQIMGGPAFYISRGLNNKPLAAFFAVSIIIALGFIGNMVQANSIADGFHKAFEIPQWATGIFVFAIAGFIFIGGVRRIASFAEKMVPLMAVVYILGSLTIIFSNYDMILPAFKEIIVGAFDPSAATGGIIGASLKEAIRYGVARGLFSNEAGMGSTPHAHALAQVKHPCEQGLVAYVGLFFDTFIVLNMTALVILTTGVLDGKSTGIVLTQAAFTAGLGDIGPGFVAICLFFFAFTTIVGWYFFGEQNVKYLLGLRWVQSYRVLVLCFLMLGSFLHVTLVWELADFFNGIMVIPNVIALLALSGLVAKVLKDYDTKFMLGETPEYGALSPSGGEPFSLEPSPRKGRRFSRLKLRLRRKKTPPVNLDEMDQLKERGLDRF